MPFPILTARWTNLLLVTYAVPPEVLRPRLVSGLQLDLRDGQAFVSLVAFEFHDTRFMGIPWPGYRHFAELNLRCYVRQGDDRGVMFIREYVSQRLVAGLARLIYNEPYAVGSFVGRIDDLADCLSVDYRLTLGQKTHRLKAKGRKPAYLPAEDSVEHFFKEHHWGFGISRKGKPIRYAVDHPKWEAYPIESFSVDLDWESVYGPEWGFMQDAKPYSTILAAGSGVRVYGGRTLSDAP